MGKKRNNKLSLKMEQELMIQKEERDYPKIKVKKEEGETK